MKIGSPLRTKTVVTDWSFNTGKWIKLLYCMDGERERIINVYDT